VSDYLGRARVAGLGWPLPEGMDEERLDALLFPVREAVGSVTVPVLNMVYIRNEMKRQHVTLQLLWEEYRSHTPDGYSYSQYCQLYRNWLGKQAISLRQEHRAGEKLFIDEAYWGRSLKGQSRDKRSHRRDFPLLDSQTPLCAVLVPFRA